MLLGTASLGLVLGLLLAARWHAGLAGPLLLVVAFLALALLLWLGRVARLGVAAAGIALLFVGLARASCSPPQPLATHQLLAWEGQQVTVEGRVVDDPEQVGGVFRLRLRGEVVLAGPPTPPRGQRLGGDLLVTTRPWKELVERRADAAPRYGDVLRLQGRLATLDPFGGFDYRAYLAQQGFLGALRDPHAVLLAESKGSPVRSVVFAVRRKLAGSLQGSLPEPQASLAQAVLLGLRRELPAQVQEDFARTGTMHLLAISGMNISILLGVLLVVVEVIAGRRRWGLLVPLIGVWAYAGVSGAEPPVLRAAIMGTLVLWARYEGRPSTGVLALAVTAALMALITPSILLSVSFQLSFAAMAGLVMLAPPLQAWMERRLGGLGESGTPLAPALRGVAAAVATGIAATAATLPLTAFYFHRLPLLGIPATLVALPAMPLAIVLPGAAGVAGVLWSPLGQALGWLSWLPLTYLLKVAHLATLPAGVSLGVSAMAPAAVWGYYGVLALAVLALSRWRQRWTSWRTGFTLGFATPSPSWTERGIGGEAVWRRLPKKSLATALLFTGLLLWAAALAAPARGLLRVVFLDVGQGDAALIITPSGRQVLVDGGPDPRRVLRGLGERVPFWDRTMDVVVLTHPDQDHVGGLAQVVARYQPALVLERREGASSAYLEWRKAVERRAARRLEAVAGEQVSLGDGVVLQVLSPPERLLEGTGADDNNGSVVLRLVYGRVAFLLPGDVEQVAERFLVGERAELRSTVLKAPHHGSRTSSSSEFLQAVAPVLVVVSVGERNPFGHPHPETMTALADTVGRDRVLTTAERGDIALTTDGKRLWLETER